MSAVLATPTIVIPAKAGIHLLRGRFELNVPVMGPRLRGNDEVEKVGGAL